MSERKIGLARVLSKLGYCSRSKATERILQGRVQLNGRVSRNPEHPVRLSTDRILVDGQCLRPTKKIYLMMNKPRSVVTTAADENNRRTVYEFLPEELPWVAPVGRLDKASEGLLLLTNDSEWAARVTAPESHLDKVYHVQIAARPTIELQRSIRNGVRSRGENLAMKSLEVLREGSRNCWLEIVLDEGRNRHIRRIFEALDIDVLRLVRVAIGPLRLGDLPKGSVRELIESEKSSIESAMAITAVGHQSH